MSLFSDLLNKPLPSKVNSITESTDETIQETEDNMSLDMAAPGAEVECGVNGSSCEHGDEDDVDGEDLDDIDDDIDVDSLSDEDLAAIDAELTGGSMPVSAGTLDLGPDEGEVDLTPEEEMEADDLMSMAATTMLVNDELSAEEKVAFVQNEGEIAVEEGFMTDADVNQLALEAGLVQEAKYTNKMIIRLDAESKKKQLYALALNVCAASKHDPDYIKLKKVMKMRKILRAKLARKYHSEATKRMKVYFARLRNSKGGMLSKIGAKFANNNK